MSFRSAPGNIVLWQSTTPPDFCNFAFCESHYRAHSVLRRILSLVCKQKSRSILVEEIRASDSPLLTAENEALALRNREFEGSTVHRLTFFQSPANTPPQPHEFLGYAVFKLDKFEGRLFGHVYEAVIKPIRGTKHNTFLHTRRNFDLATSVGAGVVPGVLYAQQNNQTFACAHVALRSALSSILPQGEVTYSELNAVAGVDHQDPMSRVGEGTGRGLKRRQIDAILHHYGVPFRRLMHEPNVAELPEKIEYQAELYAALESGRPALLGFALSPDAPGFVPARHLIPVIGHTFNDDAWVPDAERFYFPRNQGYFRSESWLSTYVVHDDNLGPYYCLPRHFLDRQLFRLLYSLQPKPSSLSISEAEALAFSALTAIHTAIPVLGVPWYDRFAVYARTKSLILRSFQLNRRQYLDHLGTIRDAAGERFPVSEIAKLETALPEYFWLSEISVPELFSTARQKVGEIAFPPDRMGDGPSVAPFFTRLPGVIIRGLTPQRIQPEGHTPLLTITDL